MCVTEQSRSLYSCIVVADTSVLVNVVPQSVALMKEITLFLCVCH